MAVSSLSAKRRDVVTLWMKQLVNLHERQGNKGPAAAGWMGAIYALRAASRLDGNHEWGRLGDEIISNLENAYLDVMGADGQKQIEAGRKLLETHHKPTLPTLPLPKKPGAPGALRSLGRMATRTGLAGALRPSVGATRPVAGVRPAVTRPPLATRPALSTVRPSATTAARASALGTRPAMAAAKPLGTKPLATKPAPTIARPAARKPVPPVKGSSGRGSSPKAGKARRRG